MFFLQGSAAPQGRLRQTQQMPLFGRCSILMLVEK
jgi:hypothetical protein